MKKQKHTTLYLSEEEREKARRRSKEVLGKTSITGYIRWLIINDKED